MEKLLTSFVIGLALAFSALPSLALDQQERPQHWGTLVSETHNFYQMSPWVFRSEQPSAALVEQLKAHEISVVINLRSRDKDKEVLSSDEFRRVHIPIHTWAISRDDLLRVMKAMRDAQVANEKVLIHCYHGSDRTGASVAMYRIIFEGWSIEDALREMKKGGYGFHPIWINIERLFTAENVDWIRQQLSVRSTAQVKAQP
ncbi:dual specificity protein phosphatase family protein [Ectopseudomonas mendocina]|uniref:Dual specificity protein phosphatase family protein n=1 Tax=Ectopseudomonas mendocina TaxID=300 RepID=A0ABZ2RJ05_ECTME